VVLQSELVPEAQDSKLRAQLHLSLRRRLHREHHCTMIQAVKGYCLEYENARVHVHVEIALNLLTLRSWDFRKMPFLIDLIRFLRFFVSALLPEVHVSATGHHGS